MIESVQLRSSKITIYDNVALNVFLYNLSEDLIRIVRLKGCVTLEQALSVVLEEVNFQFQYHSKNKTHKINSNIPKPQTFNTFNNPGGFKPIYTQTPPSNPLKGQNFIPNPQFKFGIPQNQTFRSPSGFTTPRFMNPSQGFQSMPTQQYFKFHPQNQQFKFGIQQPQGYRPNFQQSQHQPWYRPQPPQQFKFGVRPQQFSQRQIMDTDVSMRTAPPIKTTPPALRNPNQLFYNNEVVHNFQEDYLQDYDDSYNESYLYNENVDTSEYVYPTEEPHVETATDMNETENFQALASETNPLI